MKLIEKPLSLPSSSYAPCLLPRQVNNFVTNELRIEFTIGQAFCESGSEKMWTASPYEYFHVLTTVLGHSILPKILCSFILKRVLQEGCFLCLAVSGFGSQSGSSFRDSFADPANSSLAESGCWWTGGFGNLLATRTVKVHTYLGPSVDICWCAQKTLVNE